MFLTKYHQKLRKSVLFLCIIFFSLESSSQKLSINQKQTIFKDLSAIIDKDAEGYIYNASLNNFTITKNDTFYNPAGFHFLYRLKNDSAIRLDKSVFHGHNFNRLFYNYNSRLYLLGGYGYFTTNNNLEVFDSETKEWSYVSTTGEKPEFILGVVYKNGDYIYCLNSVKSGNSIEPDSMSRHVYVLDLKTNRWEKYKNLNNELVGIDFHVNFNSPDFIIGFCKRTDKFLIINKKKQRFLVTNLPKLKLNSNHFEIKELDGNNIVFLNTASISRNNVSYSVNLDSLYIMHTSEFKPLLLKPSIIQQNQDIIQLLVVLIVAIIILGIVVRKYIEKNNYSKKDQQSERQISKYIEMLCQIESSQLTLEELDEVLEINHMESESKKSKRHRILATIKQDFPGFISRVKDENDKRKFIYLIDKKAVK